MIRHAFLLLLIALAACAPQAPAPTEVAMLVAPNRILNFWETASDTPGGQFAGQPWQFVGIAGDSVRLRLDSQSAGITLSLAGPDGAVLARGNDIQETLPTNGIYVALVRFAPGDTTPYSVTLEYTDRYDPSKPTPTPTATLTPSPTWTPPATATPTPVYEPLGALIGTLRGGTPIDGAFSPPGDRHVYLFDGVAGQFVSIRMARVSGATDPALRLYDPTGNPVASDDNSGGSGAAYLRNIRLPETGEYSVQASGKGLAGEYRIGLAMMVEREPVTPMIPAPTATPMPSPTPEPRADRLVDHVPVTGRIARPGDFVRYPVVALQGEVFTIGVSPVGDASIRPEIELYSPSGELVQTATVYTSNAGGDALIPAFHAVESGTYVVLVQAEGNAVGEFVIAYGLGASRENVMRGAIPADAPVSGEIARRGYRDVWSLSLNEGDMITVSASPQSSTLDPALELVAPDGTIIGVDDNSGGGRVPLLNSLRAPQSGAYGLRVTASNAASSGVYTLVWRYVAAAPTPTPPAATILVLSADDIIPPQTYLDFPFQGQSGQRIVVRVVAKPDSGLDPVAALMDADGTTLARADDNGSDLNPLLEFILPTDGTYFVRIDGYQSSGGFNLTVEALY